MGMGTGRRHGQTRTTLVRLCAGIMCLGLFAWLVFGSGGRANSGEGSGDGAVASARRCDLSAYDTHATTELNLKNCKLQTLPTSIAQFHALVKLDVSQNQALRDLPPLPPSLTTVFALGCAFETIPPSVAALPVLRMLSFKSCSLRDVGALPLPPTLQWLILTDNQLSALPDSFGQLVRMRKLMLANNRLASLPHTMASMHDLELLRLSNNALPSLPKWLLHGAALPKLTWLAVAGNPCIAPAPARASLPAVKYDELKLGARLGEGTSSIVRRGEWHGQTVAVKEYAIA